MTDLPLVQPAIAIYTAATGALVLLAPADTPLRAGQASTPLSDYRDDTHAWSATARAMVEDAAKVDALLVSAVKASAETRRMGALSRGYGKADAYAQKQREVLASATVAAAVLNALTSTAAAAQYPSAAMEARLTGEPLATVLARFRAGYTATRAAIDRIEAIEQAGCRAIKAASTPAAKRAASTAINWSWSA